MARELFVDTSGFFALLVRRDSQHEAARRLLRRAKEERRRFLTTDYVLDETATLLKVRGELPLAKALFEHVFQSRACRVEWTDQERFARLQAFFLKHEDQAWSFTNCLSFLLMKEYGLREALTTDAHFEQAGFVKLLK